MSSWQWSFKFSFSRLLRHKNRMVNHSTLSLFGLYDTMLISTAAAAGWRMCFLFGLAFQSFVEKKEEISSTRLLTEHSLTVDFQCLPFFWNELRKKIECIFCQRYLVLLLLIRFAMNAVAVVDLCTNELWRPVVRTATSLIRHLYLFRVLRLSAHSTNRLN